MTDFGDARLGHPNLIAYSRIMTQWGSAGALLEEDGALFYAGGSWLPVGGNGAFRTADTYPPHELVDRADAFFGRLKRGYSIKVRQGDVDTDLQSACEERGLVAFGDPEPQMVCRRRLIDLGPPDGVDLRTVVDARGVADFVSINTDAYATYGMPSDVLADMFDRPDQVLANADTRMVVAYRDSRPVATALTFVSDGVASLQWVGTVAEVRQMKLGTVVTVWATNAAFDMGAATCTLQASPMGEPLYAKLGYETAYHYREYVRWSAKPT